MAAIECLICLCEYTCDGEHVPLMLQCGHFFCECCLRDYLSGISGGTASYPPCMSNIQEPLDEIFANSTMISYLEYLKQARKAANYKRTDGCTASATVHQSS